MTTNEPELPEDLYGHFLSLIPEVDTFLDQSLHYLHERLNTGKPGPHSELASIPLAGTGDIDATAKTGCPFSASIPLAGTDDIDATVKTGCPFSASSDLSQANVSENQPRESFTAMSLLGRSYEVRVIVANEKALGTHLDKLNRQKDELGASADVLYGFGFFGIRHVPLKACAELMEADAAVCRLFPAFPDLWAYLSYQREGQHEWGNIVLTRTRESVANFMSISGHATNTAALASKWFKGVMKPYFCARLQGGTWKVTWDTILTIDMPNHIRQRRSMEGWESYKTKI